MPRIAKKVPKSIPLFAAYAKKHEKHRKTQESIDLFLGLCQERWEDFADSNNRKVKTKEKKPVDPIKNLGKAMNKVSEQVEAMQDDAKALTEVKEKIQEITPAVLLDVLNNKADGAENQLVGKVVPAMQYLDKILEFCLKKTQEEAIVKALLEGKACIQNVREDIHDNSSGAPREMEEDNEQDEDEEEEESGHDEEENKS